MSEINRWVVVWGQIVIVLAEIKTFDNLQVAESDILFIFAKEPKCEFFFHLFYNKQKSMKKYLLMLFAIFLYGAMAQAADPELALSGDGTEANPYLLTSKADIKALADACNTNATSTAGHYSGMLFEFYRAGL